MPNVSLKISNNNQITTVPNIYLSSAQDVFIEFNESLIDLNGISADSIFNLKIVNNPNLTSFGMNVDFINSIRIDDTPSLTDLSEFANTGTTSFILRNNANLNSLSALSNSSGIQFISLINNDNITDLTGLENTISLQRGLAIIGNDNLTSLSGLENLLSCGPLSIEDNPNLSSLAPLSNLQEVVPVASWDVLLGWFKINNNDALVNLQGLENIQTINLGGYNTSIEITENNNLTDIGAIGNLSSISAVGLVISDNNNLVNMPNWTNLNYLWLNHLWIENNNVLTNIFGLDQLNHLAVNDLKIQNNPLLNSCSSNFTCNYLQSGNPATIANNNTGCNNTTEIEDACTSLQQIHYPVFYDLNENGLLDSGEPLIPVGSVNIEPGNITVYPNAANGGVIYLPEGTYTTAYVHINNSPWVLTTDSTQVVTIDLGNPSDTVYFGLKPSTSISALSSTQLIAQIRCNQYNTLSVNAQNNGTTIASGTMWVTVDENIQDVVFIDQPDTIVAPSSYGWHFADLAPGNTLQNQLTVLVPGPPDFPVGGAITNSSHVDFTDVNGSQQSAPFASTQIVLCAYDPNDKLVFPQYQDNYNLIGEDLIYTIRFQNTGNAEAYNITITDQLDSDLDPSTFALIGSSHEAYLTTTLSETNMLTFDFRDIFLPDSTTNFDESQGYVMYRIRAQEGTPEETLITNSAGIYFDQNPPILTNVTESIMLSTFDADNDGYTFFEDCDDANDSVYPNNTEEPYNGFDDDCDPMTLDDDLDQDGFALADDCDDNDASINADATEVPYNGIDEDCNPMTLDDDLDQDGFALADDCDDNDASVNADATEVSYNGIDEDCNPMTLDDDLDQDGFALADDCDDNDASINADATEVPYNGIDEDCDPLTLDDDLDQDGFALADDCDDNDPGINADATEVPYNGIDEDCNPMTLDDDLDQDGFALADDCDDNDPGINADATEVPYNGIDEDCNPMTLDDDLDQDGFALADDCDDTDPGINADATEVPYNGIDEDCNPMTLDDDLDQDGFALADDCDDDDPGINADATEVPYNGIDEDCNPMTLDDDLDQDGFALADDCDDDDPGINADATEVPYNGIDEDCNPMTLDDDLDQDGFALADDCDDDDPGINADAEDIPNNGIDENCDGEDAIVSVNALLEESLLMYPNPTTGFLNIEMTRELEAKLFVRDVRGQLLMELGFRGRVSVDLSALARGVYLVRVRTADGDLDRRVVRI